MAWVNALVTRRANKNTPNNEETEYFFVARYVGNFVRTGGGVSTPPPIAATLPPPINYRRQHINENRKGRVYQTRRKR